MLVNRRWLSAWFGATRSTQPEFERLGEVLDRFAALSLGQLPAESLAHHPRKQRNAMAFHFGAIDYLAACEALGETETLALYVRFLQRHALGGTPQTGSVTHLLEEFTREDERQQYRRAGLEAMQRWLADGNEKSAKRLSEMLRLIQG